MWQNILVIAIVAATAALVAWSFYRKLTGRSSCCGGCSGKGSCAGGSTTDPRPLNGPDCGCGR
jgi:hypothetical protein